MQYINEIGSYINKTMLSLHLKGLHKCIKGWMDRRIDGHLDKWTNGWLCSSKTTVRIKEINGSGLKTAPLKNDSPVFVQSFSES